MQEESQDQEQEEQGLVQELDDPPPSPWMHLRSRRGKGLAKGCKGNVDVCAQHGRMYAATHTLVVSSSRFPSFVSLVLVITQNKEP